MFPSTSLLAFVLLALTASVPALPLAGREARTTNRVALPFTTKFSAMQHGGGNGTGHAILQADLARIAHMNVHGQKMDEHFKLANGSTSAKEVKHKRAAYSFGVTNAAVTYTASVGVGSPATQYTLVIDTGSSNTWVGANKKYATTSTSRNTGNAVSVSYGSGSFSGTQYTDRVTLSSKLVIPQQSIGVASTSQGFQGVDGILGVGPTVLTSGTVKNTGTVPTVTDNLFAQHSISTDLLTVYFNPTTSQSTNNGVLSFGGVDSAYHVGDVTYAPITRTSPAKYYWGIDQSVNYGGMPVLATTAGIVDTGTTLIYLATDAYDKYVSYTGAAADGATGFLRIAPAQYNALKNLNFVVAGRTFALTPNGQIWPRALNTYIGGSSDYVYLVVGDLGSRSGGGLDFINGYAFLERFLSVYDSGAGRVGLATTRYTGAQTN